MTVPQSFYAPTTREFPVYTKGLQCAATGPLTRSLLGPYFLDRHRAPLTEETKTHNAP